MDRFELAKEFQYIKTKDTIHSLTDPHDLKEMALLLLELNYRLRKALAIAVKDEVPEIFLPQKDF